MVGESDDVGHRHCQTTQHLDLRRVALSCRVDDASGLSLGDVAFPRCCCGGCG